jgi:uncharacterized damage-inducible protein DinB
MNMKSFFQEIFEYHHYFNQKLFSEIESHFEKLPQRSFPLFCHMLNAHQIWNARITGQTPFVNVFQVNPMDSCLKLNNDNYNTTLEIIETTDLEKLIDYKTLKGDAYSNTLRDILFHVANHTTHHRAQIVSDFRQAGIQPLMTDWIFYKR